MNLDINFIILLVLAGFSYLTHNHTVTFSVLLLLFFKLTLLSSYLPFLNKYGLTIGVIILTAAMMVPMIDGTISYKTLINSFKSWQSVLAICVGIGVSWLGTRGAALMSISPTIVTSLIIGTLIGVSFFKGIPVGPLIAAGILSLFIHQKG